MTNPEHFYETRAGLLKGGVSAIIGGGVVMKFGMHPENLGRLVGGFIIFSSGMIACAAAFSYDEQGRQEGIDTEQLHSKAPYSYLAKEI